MKAFVLVCAVFISTHLWATNYYVSTAGNNANSGTTTVAPWLTIQYALLHAYAGDVIQVMAGTYNGKVTWSHSGTAGNYITLKNYNADIVILDGTSIGNNTELLLVQSKNYIKIEGLKFTNHSGHYQPVIHLYQNCNHVEISNCEFYNTACNESYAILIEGYGDDFYVHDNYIHDMTGTNAIGIACFGTGTDTPLSSIVITNNHVQHIEPAPSEAIAVNGNIDGFTISYNLVEDVNNIGIVMIGGEDWVNTNPDVDFSRNGTCSYNTVIHANSIYGGGYAGGIYVDGGKNIIVENNTVTGSDIGMEIGCENHGFIAENITVRNNTLYKNEKSGLGFGGYDFPATGQVQNCTFRGNTVFDNDLLNTGFGQLWIQYALNCTVENNIFYSTSTPNLLNAETVNVGMGNMLNYNLWFYSGGDMSSNYFWDGALLHGFMNYQSATGQENNSLHTDPLFIAIADPFDFHLQPLSPAINAGNPFYISGGADDVDMDGDARILGGITDIGNDEKSTLPLQYTTAITAATCYGTCNGTLAITPANGCAPYTIEYKKSGLPWATYVAPLTTVCAGKYQIKITDACDSIITGMCTITQDPLLNASVTSIINETTPGSADGKITAKATGGFGLKQFSKDGGITWQLSKKFTGLVAGIYTILVKDAHGCTASTTATVGLGMKLEPTEISQIFPNPNNGNFQLHITSEREKKILISVYSLTSQKIFYAEENISTGYNAIPLMLANTSKGLYMLTIDDGETTEYYKLMVQ